jgi:hypothetical protein
MMKESQSVTVRPFFIGLRCLLLIASGLVIIAGFQLFVLTEQTDRYFAWTIQSHLTAAFLGAFYWASFVLTFMTARERTWAGARVSLPGTVLFTLLTLFITLLHIDRFHLNSPDAVTLLATWAWIIIYLAVPLLLIVFLIFQFRIPGNHLPAQSALPLWWRSIFGISGIIILAVGIALMVTPKVMGSFWPWAITPLTGRAIGAWFIGSGTVIMGMLREKDCTRIEKGLLTAIVLGLLHMIVLARYPGEVKWHTPYAWAYLAFPIGGFVLGLYGWIKARQIIQATSH